MPIIKDIECSDTHDVELELDAWGVSWVIYLTVTEHWSRPVSVDSVGNWESTDFGLDVTWQQVDWYTDSILHGKTIRVGGSWGPVELDRLGHRAWMKLIGLIDHEKSGS